MKGEMGRVFLYIIAAEQGGKWGNVLEPVIPILLMGLPDGRKSFKIGLVVLIQYRL